IVAAGGAVPATIAVVGGRVKVGLTDDELEVIARGSDVYKASRMDLPVLIEKGWHGATTVAASIAIAERVGIAVFATGGIGGVHRDAPDTFDVSADLPEIAQRPVAVVCSGAKTILDIGWTLEYLETLGVPVLGYRTDEMPAFLCRSSGFPVDYRVESAEEIARVMRTQWGLGFSAGIIVANPIDPADALDPDWIESIIEEALFDAERRGIHGKAVTPFLLAAIQAKTGGRSLKANIALVKGNAGLAAEIARSFAVYRPVRPAARIGPRRRA
ncbi:MAG TPA: pseudouridine-5'-phosphate glycosidase, partial [Limnochordia bacterium]